MREILYIFIGSGIGGVTRFGLDRWISNLHATKFPWGTLVVNLTACFLLGIILGLGENRDVISPETKLFWAIGFCGSFSTFSAFSSEALNLLQSGNYLINFIYVPASVMLSMIFIFAGMALATKL